jgi:hypothetical protein
METKGCFIGRAFYRRRSGRKGFVAGVIARSAATKQSSGAARVFWIASLRSQ